MLRLGVETTGDSIFDGFIFKHRREEPKVAPIRKLWEESQVSNLIQEHLKRRLTLEIKEEMHKPRRLAQVNFGGYDGYSFSREHMQALGMSYPHISAYMSVDEVIEVPDDGGIGTHNALTPHKIYGLILTRDWLFGSYKNREFTQLTRPERITSPRSLQILVDRHIRDERRRGSA